MTGFQDVWVRLTSMNWSDFLDIIVVAFLIYKITPLLRSAGALRILKAIVMLLVISVITDVLDLYTMNFLVNQVLSAGLLAIVVLFQPEIRRVLDHLGNVQFAKFLGIEHQTQEMDTVISQTVMACETMSRGRVGALIVFARDNPMDEYFKTGTMIEGIVSEQLIRNIFFTNASLHDGAMIIRDGRIAAAGCVLPLSDSNRLSADLGTRHRAGVGLSEASDAVVVIVSEETGTISVAVGGMLKRHLAPQTLERLLRTELISTERGEEEKLTLRLRQKLQIKGKGNGKHEK
jgi:diadenylate cyclase